jgi:hypothetical protein
MRSANGSAGRVQALPRLLGDAAGIVERVLVIRQRRRGTRLVDDAREPIAGIEGRRQIHAQADREKCFAYSVTIFPLRRGISWGGTLGPTRKFRGEAGSPGRLLIRKVEESLGLAAQGVGGESTGDGTSLSRRDNSRCPLFFSDLDRKTQYNE